MSELAWELSWSAWRSCPLRRFWVRAATSPGRTRPAVRAPSAPVGTAISRTDRCDGVEVAGRRAALKRLLQGGSPCPADDVGQDHQHHRRRRRRPRHPGLGGWASSPRTPCAQSTRRYVPRQGPFDLAGAADVPIPMRRSCPAAPTVAPHTVETSCASPESPCLRPVRRAAGPLEISLARANPGHAVAGRRGDKLEAELCLNRGTSTGHDRWSAANRGRRH